MNTSVQVTEIMFILKTDMKNIQIHYCVIPAKIYTNVEEAGVELERALLP
jgi:hypothetical protein